MCNTSYCVSKAIDSNEVMITNDSTEMETIKGEITRVSELNVTELTKDGSEGRETTIKGYTYIPNTDSNETYLGILYLDPTDLSATCNAELATANKQGQDVNGIATLTGTKTGCMRWFAFGENETPTTAILDHNTTPLAVYDFENKNSEVNGRVQNDYEADWQLAQDIANWDSSLSARFPVADEVARAGGITGFSGATTTSGGYLGGGNSATQNGKYWWLYTNLNEVGLNGVGGYNGQGNDNNIYQYYSNASGSTGTSNIYGYWTSTPTAGFTDSVWKVSLDGGLYRYNANKTYFGVRPVISLSSLDLSN